MKQYEITLEQEIKDFLTWCERWGKNPKNGKHFVEYYDPVAQEEKAKILRDQIPTVED